MIRCGFWCDRIKEPKSLTIRLQSVVVHVTQPQKQEIYLSRKNVFGRVKFKQSSAKPSKESDPWLVIFYVTLYCRNI